MATYISGADQKGGFSTALIALHCLPMVLIFVTWVRIECYLWFSLKSLSDTVFQWGGVLLVLLQCYGVSSNTKTLAA